MNYVLNKILIIIFFLLLSTALISCGGGGGGGGSGGGGGGGGGAGGGGGGGVINSALSFFTGMGSFGPFQNSVVKIFKLNSSGQRAELIASTSTDANGSFSASFTPYLGAVLVVATDGSYREESSNNTVSFGSEEVYAILPFLLSNQKVAITPLTHIAAVRALSQIAGGINATQAIQEANSLMARAAGFDFTNDVTSILPANPFKSFSEQNILSNSKEAKHAMVLAGFSEYAASQGGFNSLHLSKAFAEDFLDGVFDGKNLTAPQIQIDNGSGSTTPLAADAWNNGLYVGQTAYLNKGNSDFNVSTMTAPESNPGNIPFSSRVLVVYNSNEAESLDVANYYISRRNIPDRNKCAVSFSATDWLYYDNRNTEVYTPIKNCLEVIGKQKILYIVFSYKTPFRFGYAPNGFGQAIDSQVSMIWNDEVIGAASHPYFATVSSKVGFYKKFESLSSARSIMLESSTVYSVWRLDAPSVALATGLVDKAMSAEATGVLGQGCFDRRYGNIQNVADSSYGTGDWDIYKAGQFISDAGFQITEDENEAEFGTSPAPQSCTNAAFYAGWYSYGNYNNAFTWNTGAIGFHLDSASAAHPRVLNNWAAGAVSNGITITSGAVDEPLLEGLPHPDGVFRNLLEGANAGDAFLRNTRYLRWMIINIGDPLYTPFPGGIAPFN